ncbi:MAG TPA: hypothetical protein VJQ49_01105 [Casimicrobiaceae bacterium]|nr:hypothetical protein [Casimicrobiaceae bacterium]
MNPMRTLLAVAVASICLHAQQADAIVILSNGSTQVTWSIGQPEPSINENVTLFSAAVCGQELSWLSTRFPGLPMRTLTATPGPYDCVIYRGDDARFIADNLVVNGKTDQ